MRRIVIFSLLFSAFPAIAGPVGAPPAYDSLSYPAGKSFTEVAETQVLPYFDQANSRPLTFGQPRLHLFDRLNTERRRYYHEVLKFDRARFIGDITGSTMHFGRDMLMHSDGRITRPINRTTPERLGLSLAAYDAGAGLYLDFAPLRHRALLLPMSYSNLRVYTTSGNGVFFDKRYVDICAELRRIRHADFYWALVDFAITGERTALMPLPEAEQELIVDIVAISIAEYHLESRLFEYYNEGLKARTGAIYNSLLTLLYNHGGWQLAQAEAGLRLQRGSCDYFQTYYVKLLALSLHNERLTTHALRARHPHEFALIAARLDGKHGDNFFDMLAYMIEHPDHYDSETRMAVRRIIRGFRNSVPSVNRQLAAHQK
jgi:hypothetical protein